MKTLLLLFTFFVALSGFSQNKSWCLAPSYIPTMQSPVPNDLPNNISNAPSGPENVYETYHAQGSSNIISNAQGEVLFFVIDGAIYDGQGQFMDFTYYNNNGNFDLDYKYDLYSITNNYNDLFIVQDGIK